MLKKPWRTIKQNNGELKIFSNNHWKEIEHSLPEEAEGEGEESEAYFNYKQQKYFLRDFMRIDKTHPDHLQEFDGILSLTAFSGIMIKISSCGDSVKVFYYYS